MVKLKGIGKHLAFGALDLGLTVVGNLKNRNTVSDYDSSLFNPKAKQVMVFAHQDDEIGYAGLVQRIRANGKYIWITNGDGPAVQGKISPADYAEQRKQESRNAMTSLGVSLENISELGESEIRIYNLFKKVSENRGKEEALNEFGKMADRVCDEVKQAHPDAIWTLAYQQGHPEHDLANLLSSYARKRIEKEEGRKIKLFEMPLYESSTIMPFIPFRFRPGSNLNIHQIGLTDEELAKKLAMANKYPSQLDSTIKPFKLLINSIGYMNVLRGKKPFDYQDFARKEVFREVPRDTDCSKSSHTLPWESYMLLKGMKFNKVMKPIAEYLDNYPGKVN